jgi:diphthamide biosynthesis protein 4
MSCCDLFCVAVAIEHNSPKQASLDHKTNLTVTAMVNEELSDYYSLLRITRSASPNTIKAAYHRALLRAHPDKIRQRADNSSQLADVGLLHDAFVTLSSATLRSAYDAQGMGSHRMDPARPSQVVSLERFGSSDLQGPDGRAISTCWTFPCRCGGKYEITEDHLERGLHLVGCGSCSEVIWVGYEMVNEVDGEDTGQLETK